MDFFEFFNLSDYVTIFFPNANSWVTALVVGCVGFLIMYAFRSISLYTIATKGGYKYKWMSFVPFVNTYYIGHVSDKNKIFNQHPKVFSIPTAVLEVCLFAAYALGYICYFLLDKNKYISYTYNEAWGVYEASLSAYLPMSMNWMGWCFDYLLTICNYVDFLYMILLLFTFMPFFQTYNARGYAIMSVFAAVFPISGILMFVVRNNRGKNYREYVRAQQERQYRQYQQYQQGGNPYNYNPYTGQPYNRNPGQGQPMNNQGDYGQPSQTDSDPFDDFDLGSAGSPSTSGSYGTEDMVHTDKTEKKTKAEKTKENADDGSPFDDFN